MPSRTIDNALDIMLAATLTPQEQSDRRARQATWKATSEKVGHWFQKGWLGEAFQMSPGHFMQAACWLPSFLTGSKHQCIVLTDDILARQDKTD